MSSFFDTNILVYMFDTAEPAKAENARSLFLSAHTKDEIVLSTQVLQEFFVNVTRKLQSPLPYREALSLLHEYSHLRIVRIEPETIIQAASRAETAMLSFWDALIVEAALDAGAQRLYTEDLQHGQSFENLQIINPFRDSPK